MHRNLGVLQYSDSLCNRIDALEEIPFGSEEEVEIRAATVVAVERLHKLLVAKGVSNLLVIEVDWLLWQKGEVLKDDLFPHHRTLTIYY